MKLPELPDLPVRAVLDEVVETLAEHGTAVLVAPPGTGKTTLVPLALAAGTSGRVVVAEPRRLAARAAAGRMAALLGESVGATVGYSVRGDRRVGPGTRVEVVTSGLLVRRLQNDPELAGVDVVVLDECHERHLDADLLLALLLDARAGLRPDLRVLATSATVAADRLAALLGGAGPAVELPGNAGSAPETVSGGGSASGLVGGGGSASGLVGGGGSASGSVGGAGSEPELLGGAGTAGVLCGGVSSAPGVVGGAGSAAEVAGSGGSALESVGSAGRAPIVEVHGRAYPVEMEYISALPKERVEAHVARVTRSALAGSVGDVLVFLPGAAEIRRVAAQLAGLTDIDVMPLHGRLSGAAQDAALRQGSRRRIVLSTAVAESSLTVPGVRVVVDSGLARVPRVDHRRGLSGLATVRVSAAVAEQRAGRAGREAPGWAWRCWPEYEHTTLPAYPEPEIRTADLTRLALELACWGTADGQGLSWWDPPPPGALAAGREVLRALGAEESDGTVTARGRRMAALGLHPRLARALLDGAAAIGARSAAEVVALLDDDTVISTVDLVAGIRILRADPPQRWKREVDRLTRLVENAEAESTRKPKASSSLVESVGVGPTGTPKAGSRPVEGAETGSTRRPKAGGRGRGGAAAASSPRAAAAASLSGATDDLALVAALAYPERLARRRGPGSPSYLMAGGTAVSLPPGSGVGEAEWLAVAGASRDPGRSEGRIRLAAIADEQLARQAAPDLVVTADEVDWVEGDVVARRVERLGAIILSEKPLRNPDRALVGQALRRGLASVGPDLLRWNADALALRQRLDFLHRTLGAPWPEVNDQALLADPDSWLGPELATANRRADLERVDAGQALRRLLPWPEAARFDELAPERLEVPSGSRVRIDYSGDIPVLAVKVQEIFGWADLPRLADGRTAILLHLLSPAQRPIAVTADLASFWRTGWPQVRAELRGRYPKHAWPEDPTTVPAHRGTSRRVPRD